MRLKTLPYRIFTIKSRLPWMEIFDKLMEYKEAIAPDVADTFEFMYRAVKEEKKILLEGQLGALKDTDFGIYPW